MGCTAYHSQLYVCCLQAVWFHIFFLFSGGNLALLIDDHIQLFSWVIAICFINTYPAPVFPNYVLTSFFKNDANNTIMSGNNYSFHEINLCILSY